MTSVVLKKLPIDLKFEVSSLKSNPVIVLPKFNIYQFAPTNNTRKVFLPIKMFFQQKLDTISIKSNTRSTYNDDLELMNDYDLELCFNKALKKKYKTISSSPVLGNAILWEAKKPGFPSIYILNTLHTLKKLNPKDYINFKHIISNVDIVYTEVNFLVDIKRIKYLKKLAAKKIKYYFDFMLAYQASKMKK